MAKLDLESNPLFQQYKLVRNEVEKSVFVQYDVIKIGTAFLSALLVAVPTTFAALAPSNLVILALILFGLAFISMSFVFIMGAGEIRIMRAAAFSSKLLDTLLAQYAPMEDRDLVWDNYVLTFQTELYGSHHAWKFKERSYLAMPFVIIAALADTGAIATIIVWLQGRMIALPDTLLMALAVALIFLQYTLYQLPAKLERELLRATEQVNKPRQRGKTAANDRQSGPDRKSWGKRSHVG
jgi:hypothetical protein